MLSYSLSIRNNSSIQRNLTLKQIEYLLKSREYEMNSHKKKTTRSCGRIRRESGASPTSLHATLMPPRTPPGKKVTWDKNVKSPRPSRVYYHKYLINKKK